MINKVKRAFYNHNEPFDFMRWMVGFACVTFKKNKVKAYEIDKYIDMYASSEVKNDNRLRRKIYLDILYSSLVFGSTFKEYFLYGFNAKTYAERRTFVTTYSKQMDFTRIINNQKDCEIFNNKYKTYLKFNEYYCRDAILVNSPEDYDIFSQFAKKHPKFVYKPISESHGNGVKLIDSSYVDSLESLFKDIIQGGECMLEERVIQAPEMSSLNPSSVNTVRVPAVLTNNGVKILYPYMKIGKDGSFVDNSGSGGIMALLDLDTGIVCATPRDKSNNKHILHPDTGAQIIGFKIPKWNEVIDLVNKLAYVVPTVRYIGWDLALTENGWVVIEGNCAGQFTGQQMLDQIGKKEEYRSLIDAI